MKYYKKQDKSSMIMFCFDESSDCLTGMIEEIKTKFRFSVLKHEDSNVYSSVSTNSLAKNIIKESVEVSKAEYEIALAVVNSLIDNDEWLIADAIDDKKEIKIEPVYVL